jgi:[ribosomal protein S18]-alanine N-acetyltransferase
MAAMPAVADVAIRPFSAADRDVALALLDSDPWRRLGYTAADWLRLLRTPLEGREGFVAVTGDAVSGLALVRPRFLGGDYLELFAVAAAARGRGVGGALLGHLETVVFARARNFFVCVSDFNDGARRFYARHGYAHVGTLPDLLVPGSAELLLRKSSGPLRVPGT